jgi:hypothetical protein
MFNANVMTGKAIAPPPTLVIPVIGKKFGKVSI